MCAGLCIRVLESHVSAFCFFGSACCCCCCCCCRIMSASRRPSSSRALHFVAGTVQQQSQSKLVWTTAYYACVDILGSVFVCAVCVVTFHGRGCVGACRSVQFFVCWYPIIISVFLLIFILFSSFASASLLLPPSNVVCITPCLKLSRSLLCGSHGTTAVAQQVCVHHFYARVDFA